MVKGVYPKDPVGIEIPVSPDTIYVLDLGAPVGGTQGAHLLPYGYKVKLVLSPMVVHQLMRWAFREGYCVLDGKITYIVDHTIRKVVGRGKSQDAKAQGGAIDHSSDGCGGGGL